MAIAAYRKHCASLPGVTHEPKWKGCIAYSVGGKMFAIFGATSFSFKVDAGRFLELTDLEGVEPAKFMARHKWVMLVDPKALPGKEVLALLTRAYELMRPKASTITFKPLTPDRWADFEDLFGPKGAVAGCWCMWWRRSSADFRANSGAGNKRAMRKIVKDGPVPGILAYDGDVAVGWCAVRPREDYPRFETSRTLKPLDEKPVWSVTCFFVRKGYRRKGLTVKLLEAAKKHVRRSGGRLIEGYPTVPTGKDSADAFAWTGLLPAFEKAGFEEKARPGARAIVRLVLKN